MVTKSGILTWAPTFLHATLTFLQHQNYHGCSEQTRWRGRQSHLLKRSSKTSTCRYFWLWLRRMVACFSPCRPGFNCRVARVKSVMEKVPMGGAGRGSLSTSILPCQSVFHQRPTLTDNEGLVQDAHLWPQDQQTPQYRQNSIVKKNELLFAVITAFNRPTITLTLNIS